MKTFCDQERFSAGAVEAVTGVKPETLRQWERRDVYRCDIRRAAAMNLNIIQSPDTPRRRRKAVELLRKYEQGWRSYTLGDLIRISLIVTLMETGIDARAAGRGAVALDLPESEPNSHPSGRALASLLSAPDLPDEHVVYVPNLLHLRNPARFRYTPPARKPGIDPGISLEAASLEWKHKVEPVLSLIHKRAGVIVNLSDIRRTVLKKIANLEDAT